MPQLFHYTVRGAIHSKRSKEGAFDGAVKGVGLVEHTTSPDHFWDTEPDDPYAGLASAHSPSDIDDHRLRCDWDRCDLKGMLCVLKSAKKFGSSIKSWNKQAIEEMKEKGAVTVALPFMTRMYRASKMLATPMAHGWLADREPSSHLTAAWEFYEKKKSSIAWDMNPPFAWPPEI
ncbi:hypothetical protein BJV78DRAFT_1155348 [Lactifluus subvellereus]|nr:hypothetical protein BJV78DRAFT_1155348 [Lactifluus subvellereus]